MERIGYGMMDLTIGEIAEACGGELVIQGKRADRETSVSSVVIDSRKVEAGGVFAATVGEQVDGHRFIASAFSKGAILAITQKRPAEVSEEHGVEASEWGNYLLVEDTLQALRQIAEAYRKKLSIKIVGLTGSSGKTTTKEFIAGVLAQRYRVLKTEGNLNNEIGVPLTLLSIRAEHEAAVVEMGISDFGEMHRLSRMVRPDICVITNIGQSHLKDLKTRDGILRAKSEIFDYMAEDGEICLNGEDDKLSALTEIKGHKPHFFGLGGNADEEVTAAEVVCKGLEGSEAVLLFRRRRDGEELPGQKEVTSGSAADMWEGMERASGDMADVVRVPIHVPLPGMHMVLNAAAAACVGRLFGLNGEEIAAGIAGTAAVSGRTNLISLPRYTLIDDCYNANPESMRAAIDMLALAGTEKAAILGDMFNLGEDSHELHGQMGRHAVEAGIERIICVGQEGRYIFQAAMDRADKAAPPVIMHFPDLQALQEALSADVEALLPKGCTVLVKASHGMEFSKVLELLKEKGNV